MELRNRKDTSQREIFIPRSRGFPVARAQNMKGWAKTSPPLLLNGANVPDNLIEKEIPLKIPPHSLAKCNCVQKFALLLPDFFLDQEFSSWHGELWQSIINFIIKNLIEILSHWIGNWVKSWFNLFSSFHIPVQFESVARTLSKVELQTKFNDNGCTSTCKSNVAVSLGTLFRQTIVENNSVNKPSIRYV